MRLGGKVAIVTGAGSGIGRAIALEFAREGARVVVAELDTAPCHQSTKTLLEAGGEAIAVQTDVSNDASARRLVETAVTQFGPPDVLVNNAAIMPMGAVTDTTQDDWDRVMAVNVRGIFHCSRHVISEMKKSKRGGSIINLGSVTAIVGTPGIAAYTASKGAVVALTRQMAIDYAADAIRVNSVSPGTVDTPMLARAVALSDDQAKARAGFDAIHPIGRVGTPKEIARAAVFLASDESSFVTGSNLMIDGGYTVAGALPID